MSDIGRKGFGEQAKQSLKPDSQKSVFEQASESVTHAGDKLASSVQPDDSKSIAQKISDSTYSSEPTAGNNANDSLNKVTDTVKDAGKEAHDTLNKAGSMAESKAGEAQDSACSCAHSAQKKSGESAGSANEQGKTLLQQGQEMAAGVYNAASQTAANLANSVSSEPKKRDIDQTNEGRLFDRSG